MKRLIKRTSNDPVTNNITDTTQKPLSRHSINDIESFFQLTNPDLSENATNQLLEFVHLLKYSVQNASNTLPIAFPLNIFFENSDSLWRVEGNSIIFSFKENMIPQLYSQRNKLVFNVIRLYAKLVDRSMGFSKDQQWNQLISKSSNGQGNPADLWAMSVAMLIMGDSLNEDIEKYLNEKL